MAIRLDLLKLVYWRLPPKGTDTENHNHHEINYEQLNWLVSAWAGEPSTISHIIFTIYEELKGIKQSKLVEPLDIDLPYRKL